jgi:hypothetical protein
LRQVYNFDIAIAAADTANAADTAIVADTANVADGADERGFDAVKLKLSVDEKSGWKAQYE